MTNEQRIKRLETENKKLKELLKEIKLEIEDAVLTERLRQINNKTMGFPLTSWNIKWNLESE